MHKLTWLKTTSTPVRSYFCVWRCTGGLWRLLDLIHAGGWVCSGGEQLLEFVTRGRYPPRQRRSGRCGSWRGSGGEGSHYNGQDLGAGQAVNVKVLVRVSVHHQQFSAVRHLEDTVHHLQEGGTEGILIQLIIIIINLNGLPENIKLKCYELNIFACFFQVYFSRWKYCKQTLTTHKKRLMDYTDEKVHQIHD